VIPDPGSAKRTFLLLVAGEVALLLLSGDSGDMESRLVFFGVGVFEVLPLLLVLAVI